MPRRRAVWSSWNYLADGRGEPDRTKPVSLTYWMNRLQNLQTRRPVFVTLNPIREPRGEHTRLRYAHPQFDRAAVDAQAPSPPSRAGGGPGSPGRGAATGSTRTGCAPGWRWRRRSASRRPGRSTRAVARRSGGRVNSAIYEGTVAHRRFFPVGHRFAYGVYYLWLDLDELLELDRSLAGFGHNRAAPVSFHDRDHGPRDGSPLRPWLDALLREAGIDLQGGPVRILTLPRILGHVFNPVSVWFGYGPAGDLRAVLYEVSNTFGQWHHHLRAVDGLDAAGNARHVFDKGLFVSPFIDQDATYEFRVRPPDERVALMVREHVPPGQVLGDARRRAAAARPPGAVAGLRDAPDGHAQGDRGDPLGGRSAVAQGRAVPSPRPGAAAPGDDRTQTGTRARCRRECSPSGGSSSGSRGRRRADAFASGFRTVGSGLRGRRPGPAVEVDLHDGRLVRRLVATGAIGLADGWIAGEFDSPDLPAVMELGGPAPRTERSPAPPRRARPRRPGRLERDRPRGRPAGPLRTTVEHYDLGNAFFRAWLDRSMTYSSAVFAREDMPLEEAQREKYRRICAAAGLREGLHVLEIGSGWGGFATHAAGEVGCRVTTVTDSREQATWVEKLVAEEGLGDRVEVRGRTSRTPGTYDAIVSIEMIESIPGDAGRSCSGSSPTGSAPRAGSACRRSRSATVTGPPRTPIPTSCAGTCSPGARCRRPASCGPTPRAPASPGSAA